MVQPDTMPPSIGVVRESLTDALDSVKQGRAFNHAPARIHPVSPQAASDDVFDRGQPVAGIVFKVAVAHGPASVPAWKRSKEARMKPRLRMPRDKDAIRTAHWGPAATTSHLDSEMEGCGPQPTHQVHEICCSWVITREFGHEHGLRASFGAGMPEIRSEISRFSGC